ncbi:S8 family serine peptidase [Xanthomonas translucens]|uniref:S8 family serine peptidase n=1 Tax=Xanthomonas campestris pv. translucens TaxID=343 RepID=UPI0002A78F95|nr:S8 family serine peptidase [Xanthomonas translucens]AKK68262.1 peptidase S8 [Xanthomonas translucens pv. undulosa]ELP96595.1 extracellular serine protease [Xanthomonas translucens DAR61454]MBC3972754.1 S8 family serine peptidase [Xanthomonas translucens pv. undulosa]MCT8271302.1 S8 family serine peptidase [Xanthomonas translucens pv. undulosa]MCT8282487.1 S8 family serine peptidase [Xanthomonas translucens pv. undulosa]
MMLSRNRHAAVLLSTLALGICNAAAAPANPADAEDPLFRYQWYLSNQGQAVIGDTLPTPGVDLDVEILHTLGIRGAGVEVAVVDSGLEIGHEDLAANMVPNGSYNFLDGSHDPKPINADDDHGTAVAGIIAAVGWNGKGGRGVAPEAALAGFNLSNADAAHGANDQRYAWGGGAEAKRADVFNNSWGMLSNFYPSFSVEDQYSWEKLMRSMRNGKGGIYVKAAGNAFSDFLVPDAQGQPVDQCPDNARRYNVGCSLANVDPMDDLITSIAVSAVNARGVRSSYSSPGSAVWVAGLGGEYGYQKRYDSNPQKSKLARADFDTNPRFDPAIVSTDLSGCAAGMNRDRSGTMHNALDTSKSPIDASCNYTASMNGTSAATPTVAGVAALMLSVNPQMTWRDVKYILATTAQQIDPGQPKAVYNGSVIDPGWITNAAGHAFSNWYGFGLVDAAAAVHASAHFVSLPPMQDTGYKAYHGPASKIGGVAAPATLSIDIKQTFKVEAVQLYFGGTHKDPSALRVVLISPHGTRSYVMTPFSALNKAAEDGVSVPLTASNAFLDEDSAGRWTLEVTDMLADTGNEKLQNFELRMVGH